MKKSYYKITVIRNLLFICAFIYLLVNHQAIQHNTQNIRYTILENTKYNPTQYLTSLTYHSIVYIVDFFSFRKNKEQNARLMLYMTSFTGDIMQTRIENNELRTILLMSKKIAHKNIVELHHSITNNSIKEVYFTSNVDIAMNGLVINQTCILGRIFRKERDRYYILMYDDPRFRLPVYSEKSKVLGLIHGGSGRMKFIPFSNNKIETLQHMETLLTASIGNHFAKNISVGRAMKGKNGITVKTDCKNYYEYALVI
ncbi:MAG: hypothetical protein ACI9CD_000197 [Candidatus Deianiraeaceae bacterium]|jgi:hypothetical protein